MTIKNRIKAIENRPAAAAAHTCEIIKLLADGSQKTINTFQTTLPVDRILVKYGQAKRGQDDH